MGKLEDYSGLILRTGIAIVFLWFGFTQLKSPDSWTRLIPQFYTNYLNPTTLVYLNGTFEIILGTLLILGLFTRTASLLLSIHLLNITYILRYGPTGARDFALSIACLSIFVKGADNFCLDKMVWKRKKEDKVSNEDKEEVKE